jgi:sugar (pentulose or hexulose) kinase
MSEAETVAVLDIGKSNVKLALVDPRRRAVLDMRTTPNNVRTDGPYPHFDVDHLWDWFLDGLRELSTMRPIDVIATTTHGACFAVVAGDDLALPILDYEFSGPEAVNDAYRGLRGGFAETLSPDLPNGLNAGRQLFWLSRTFPDAFARADAILPYPQYWTMRLTGVKVAEATSFGAHTDLWNPRAATFSHLAETEGWAALVPAMVEPWQTVGTLLPEVAERTGLAPDCRVVAGIHDSNAALLPHMLWRPLPFAVLSTGTWMITFAAGGSLDALDPSRDCLANIDAFVRPVPSAMCMAGREFEILTDGASATPTRADIERVIEHRAMVLPGLVAGSGPFGARKGGWSIDPGRLSPGSRNAAASLYAALIADTCLGLTGADGPVVIEGPFARNAVFLAGLAQLTGRNVLARPDAAGTTLGAALLALGPERDIGADADPEPTAPLAIDIAGYADEWRYRAAQQIDLD